MTDREKLIELIEDARRSMKREELSCDLARNSFIAEYLIANGVTVRENREEPLTLEIQNPDLRNIVIQALMDMEYQYAESHSLMTANVADYICQAIEESIAKNKHNDPLTLDELREMDGEPVWFESTEFEADIGWHVCYGERESEYIMCDSGEYYEFGVFTSRCIVAYRHKPEEETV